MAGKETKQDIQFNKALDLYFKNKYQEALVLFDKLLTEKLPDSLKADTLRRKGDCLTMIGKTEVALPLYQQALTLAGDNANQIRWIYASKGWCLYKAKRHIEALATYKQAIKLIDDKDDLEHLKNQVEIIKDDYEYAKQYGDFESEKERVLRELDDDLDEIQEEQDKDLMKKKPVLQA